jgi:hypothetical protein
MRIRSIKPEFWRSDDITPLPLSTRLTFVGLWSYVDDNGVGADKLVSIVADLYADDFSSDPQETVQRVSGDLQRLASGGQVTRYRGVHNGSTKDLLYITKWKEHQKVNHPSAGHKYPLPPAELLAATKGLTQPSGESLETLPHEQGNRGAGEGEQRSGGTGDEDPGPAEPPDDYIEAVVVPEYIDVPSHGKPQTPGGASKTVVRQELGNAGYPRTTLDRLAVQVGKLAHDGHPDTLIRQALRAWDQKPSGALPEWLPTILGDVVKEQRGTNVTAFDRKKAHNGDVFQSLADEPTNPELLA